MRGETLGLPLGIMDDLTPGRGRGKAAWHLGRRSAGSKFYREGAKTRRKMRRRQNESGHFASATILSANFLGSLLNLARHLSQQKPTVLPSTTAVNPTSMAWSETGHLVFTTGIAACGFASTGFTSAGFAFGFLLAGVGWGGFYFAGFVLGGRAFGGVFWWGLIR